MEKNITLQQSDIRVINAKQVQTSALLDGMKKAATTPMEWLRQYYSSVLEREVTMGQTLNISLLHIYISMFYIRVT